MFGRPLKTGHCAFQNQPLGSETGHYPRYWLAGTGHSQSKTGHRIPARYCPN
jgi:hypothetical protein